MKILVGSLIAALILAVVMMQWDKSTENPTPTISPTTGISCAVVYEPK